MNKRKKEIRNRQKMFSKFLKTFFYAKIHKKNKQLYDSNIR